MTASSEPNARRIPVRLVPELRFALAENKRDLSGEFPKRVLMESDPNSPLITIRCDNHVDGLSGEGARASCERLRVDGHSHIRADDLAGARHKFFGGGDRLIGREQETVKFVGWGCCVWIVDDHRHLIFSALHSWLQIIWQHRDHSDSPSVGGRS